MLKTKLFILEIITTIVCLLTSCSKDNLFIILERNHCSVYQYQTKDSYFSKYKNYYVFTDLNEVVYDEFTIFMINEQTDLMPEELYESIKEQFNESYKVGLIIGNTDEIKYKRLVCYCNWNFAGVVGSGFIGVSTPFWDRGSASNDRLFFSECLDLCNHLIMDFIKKQ